MASYLLWMIAAGFVYSADEFLVCTTSEMSYYGGTVSGNSFARAFPVISTQGSVLKIRLPNGEQVRVSAKSPLLRNRPGTAYVAAQQVLGTHIGQTIVTVVGDHRFVSTAGDVPCYDNPDRKGQPIAHLSPFEIRFVFDERDGAYLVGNNDRLVPGNARTVLDGWVDMRACRLWNGRLGALPNKTNLVKRRNCGLVTIEPRFPNPAKPGRTGVWHEDGSSQSQQSTLTPFPILQDKGDFCEVLYLGWFGHRPTGRQIQPLRTRLLILMEIPRSSRNYSRSIGRALNRFKHLSPDIEPRLEIVLAGYREVDNRLVWRTFRGLTRSSRDVGPMVKSTRGWLPAGSGLAEAIEAFLSRLSWGPDVCNYLVMIRGDVKPDEETGFRPVVDAYLSPPKRTRVVAKELSRHEIGVYALQLTPSHSREASPTPFQRQFFDLLSAGKLKGEFHKSNSNLSQSLFRLLQIIHFDVTEEYGSHQRQQERTDFYKRFYRGIVSTTAANLQGGTLVSGVGIVNKKDPCGNPQLATRVFLKKVQVQALKVWVQDLSEALFNYSPERAGELQTIMDGFAGKLAGEPVPPKYPVAAFVYKKSGIPLNAPQFRISLDTFREQSRQPAFRLALRKHLQACLARLEEVTREREVHFDPVQDWDRDHQIYTYRFSEEISPYFFSLKDAPEARGPAVKAGSKHFVWLPLAYLP